MNALLLLVSPRLETSRPRASTAAQTEDFIALRWPSVGRSRSMPRSTSSENRLMMWCDFEREVPPLKHAEGFEEATSFKSMVM